MFGRDICPSQIPFDFNNALPRSGRKFEQRIEELDGHQPIFLHHVHRTQLAELLFERTAGLREDPPTLRPMLYRGRAGETVAIEAMYFYGLCPHHLVPYRQSRSPPLTEFGSASVDGR